MCPPKPCAHNAIRTLVVPNISSKPILCHRTEPQDTVACIILKCKKQRNYTFEAYLNWSWLQLKDLHLLVYQTLAPNLWVENFRACPSFTCNRPWARSGQINPWIETQYICHFPWVPPWDEYQFSATMSTRYCLDWSRARSQNGVSTWDWDSCMPLVITILSPSRWKLFLVVLSLGLLLVSSPLGLVAWA